MGSCVQVGVEVRKKSKPNKRPKNQSPKREGSSLRWEPEHHTLDRATPLRANTLFGTLKIQLIRYIRKPRIRWVLRVASTADPAVFRILGEGEKHELKDIAQQWFDSKILENPLAYMIHELQRRSSATARVSPIDRGQQRRKFGV